MNNKSSLIHVGDKIKLRGSYTKAIEPNPVHTDTSNNTGNSQVNAYNNYVSNNSQQAVTNNTSNGYTAEAANQQPQAQQAQAQQSTVSTSVYSNANTGADSSAKEQIAQLESGGSYTAVNSSTGAYGKYQLLPQYLHGDYSPANQERVADQYVAQRYHTWTGAWQHWQTCGWY